MAPEMFLGNYTEKCDMWSLGVIVYALLNGSLPFDGVTEDEVIAKILARRFSCGLSWQPIGSIAGSEMGMRSLIILMVTHLPPPA